MKTRNIKLLRCPLHRLAEPVRSVEKTLNPEDGDKAQLIHFIRCAFCNHEARGKTRKEAEAKWNEQMRRKTPLPCPCCNETNIEYYGYGIKNGKEEDCFRHALRCASCGLTMDDREDVDILKKWNRRGKCASL